MIKEAKVMKTFDHANILKFYNYSKNELLTYTNGITESTPYLQLELLTGGILFDYVKLAGKGFPEEMVRFYFQQIISAVEHMYSKGFVHLDIKLDNILMDEKGNAILSDFGSATLKEGPKKDGILYVFYGTDQYMSPELQAKTPYNGEKADVFALGVCLFMLISVHHLTKKKTHAHGIERLKMKLKNSGLKCLHFST